MFKSLSVLILMLMCGTVPLAHAALSPVSLAIVPGLQFPPSDYSVTGARVSVLFGHHRDLYGLDFGVLGNVTDQSFVGIAISGIFNLTYGETRAIGTQFAGLTNINKGKTVVFGVQATAGLNSNEAASSVVGLAIAPVNLGPYTSIYGVEVGLYNKAQDVTGLQIGIVNVAKNLHGIQIGLINFHETGLFFVSPVINIGF